MIIHNRTLEDMCKAILLLTMGGNFRYYVIEEYRRRIRHRGLYHNLLSVLAGC